MRHHDIQLTGSVAVTGSFTVPVGTTEERPTNPSSGSLRVNTSLGGVVEVYNGNEWVTVGRQSGSATPGVDIEYLVVAGGGGAGFDLTAGGGAGGLLSSSLSSMESGSNITVTVGAGGAGYTSGGVTSTADGTASSIASSAGTSFTTVSTVGGGGGSRVVSTPGRDGGSGGGCGRGNQGDTNPGSGTTGQGNDGGADTDSPAGTGGGGAGAAGGTASGTGNPSTGGAGGAGKQSSITGTSTYYAGGGGGGGYYGSGGSGGSGGGGTGGTGNAQNNATNGTANTGGGAGGGEQNASVARSGGSGVVILAYPSASHKGAGGIVGDAGNGRKYNQFNTSGTFEFGDPSDFSVHTTNLVLHVDAGQYASRSGSAGLKDLSTYDNSLTMGSAGTLSDNYWWEFDGTNEGAQFERNNGSAASDVGHTGYGSFTGRTTIGFCIEFWFKSSAGDSSNTWGAPIISRNSTDIYAGIVQHGGKLTWLHYDGSWQYAKSTTDINDGSWHHCVINNSSDETVDVWVDGAKEADGVSSAINPDSRHFKMDSLGRGYNGENHDFDLGQLRVYDATLTDAQITQNYNATKTNFS